MITITAFKSVPDFAKGRVRDLRARWALEEAGLPYRSRLLGPGDQHTPEYRSLQPFGQVPVLQDGALTLFETGAIVLHIAANSPALLPADPAARLRATQWLIAALNSVEPALDAFSQVDVVFANDEWARLRHPAALAFAKRRLAGLAGALADKPYLDGEHFTAGDLMMASVLRIVDGTDLVTADTRLGPYLQRCTARPAFQRALAAQLDDFTVLAA